MGGNLVGNLVGNMNPIMTRGLGNRSRTATSVVMNGRQSGAPLFFVADSGCQRKVRVESRFAKCLQNPTMGLALKRRTAITRISVQNAIKLTVTQ
ncbi:MAG: hypothetical protein GY845_18355 [Planctomycetes bacterium]|nr:hypothetical protein [Planctomycetota bacterium]